MFCIDGLMMLFFLCRLINYVVFYGMTFNTSYLEGNLYLNFAFSGAVEIPSHIFLPVISKYVGRVVILCVSSIATGMALLPIIFIPIGE